MRYDVAKDGTVSNAKDGRGCDCGDGGRPARRHEGGFGGQRLRYGPGDVWVFSPDGKHLGTIRPPETPANCGWGDDGKTLYMTARTGLYRIKLAVAGQKLVY
jgi:gluconolactonase